MPRYFSLQDAEKALPRVRAAIRQAIELRAEMQTSVDELRELTHRVMMSGGMSLDPARVGTMHETRDRSTTRLKETLESIESLGCLVKDLDIGLLDFPTLYRGREVYLCWRLGEERIEFWHGTDEGFRGRKPITDEFLSHHRGDPDD